MTMSISMGACEDVCPECGAELDGYGPCACSLQPMKPRKPGPGFTMRLMVERKLKAKRAREGA